MIQGGLHAEEFSHSLRREQADEPAFVYDRRREGLARIESAQRGIEHVVQVDDLNSTASRIPAPTIRRPLLLDQPTFSLGSVAERWRECALDRSGPCGQTGRALIVREDFPRSQRVSGRR